MKRLAFIGTRDLTKIHPLARKEFDTAVEWAVSKEFIIDTGAAEGSDQRAAERGAESGGYIELVLPWSTYRQDWVDGFVAEHEGHVAVVTFDVTTHAEWLASVEHYHPMPERLTWGEKKLMARNWGLVYQATAVVALPKPPELGGTSHGIRIGRGLGIPVFNLSIPRGHEEWAAWKKDYEGGAVNA